jgi:hypothetical protein
LKGCWTLLALWHRAIGWWLGRVLCDRGSA